MGHQEPEPAVAMGWREGELAALDWREFIVSVHKGRLTDGIGREAEKAGGGGEAAWMVNARSHEPIVARSPQIDGSCRANQALAPALGGRGRPRRVTYCATVGLRETHPLGQCEVRALASPPGWRRRRDNPRPGSAE